MIVRPATERDIGGMVALLQGHMNPKWPPERWRRLFDYAWASDRPDLGRVVERGGEIVGCLAAVYSTREIDGRVECFCNPAAWYLRKNVRHEAAGAGLAMLRDLIADPARHYIINTSSAATVRLLRRMGFVDLETEKYVWRGPPASVSPIRVERDPDRIAARVSAAERRLLADHRGLPVTPLLARHPNGETLIVVAETIKGDAEAWVDVLYVADVDVLARHGDALAARLLSDTCHVLAADSRFCASPPPGAVVEPIAVPHFMKTPGLPRRHFDHLYSEIQLLGLKLR